MPVGLTVIELDGWLHRIRERVDGTLVRAKGMALTSDEGLVMVHVVGRRQEISVVPEPERQPPTDLVVITVRDV